MKGVSTKTTVTEKVFTSGPQATNLQVSSTSTEGKDTDINSSPMAPALR